MQIDKRQIVFFDGDCNFCNSSVDFIFKRNSQRSFYFSSLQSDFAEGFFRSFNREITLNTVYLYQNGRIYNRSRAIFLIAKDLDGPYRFFSVLRYIIPKFLSDMVYDVFAKNRHYLKRKKVSCRIPEAWELEYFVDQPERPSAAK
jgi:predicted DCC family thiol-disulfide oxidoreductase YuxK